MAVVKSIRARHCHQCVMCARHTAGRERKQERVAAHDASDQPRAVDARLQRALAGGIDGILSPVVSAKGKRSYVVRALQPSSDRVALDDANVAFEQIRGVVNQMGRIVAWAQLRSSGHQGSATADALMAFGSARKRWQAQLLEAAQQCAAQTVDDWTGYAAAYDTGAFRL